MPSFPVFLKDWQRPIQVVLPTKTTATIQNGVAAVAMKNAYVDPIKSQWRLKGCSDSVSANMSSIDLIVDDSDIIANAAGAHSWMVLMNLATGQQYCVDFNQANNQTVTLAMSVAAGFTGGSTTARPTATDEVTAVTIWFAGANTGRFRLVVVHSVDGSTTYGFIFYRGIIITSWCFGQALCHHGAWSPALYGWLLGANTLSSTGLNSSTRFDNVDNVLSYAAGGPMFLRWTRAYSNGNFLEVLQANRPSRSEKWPTYTIGLFCMNAPRLCKHGRLIDMFRIPNGIPPGWIYPSTDKQHGLLSCGIGWAIPWPVDEPPRVF